MLVHLRNLHTCIFLCLEYSFPSSHHNCLTLSSSMSPLHAPSRPLVSSLPNYTLLLKLPCLCILLADYSSTPTQMKILWNRDLICLVHALFPEHCWALLLSKYAQMEWMKFCIPRVSCRFQEQNPYVDKFSSMSSLCNKTAKAGGSHLF